MLNIYNPESPIEAQCLEDLLESHHIHCFISGRYLTGAIGELPASGLLGVYVEEQDAGLAKELINDYLSAAPVLDNPDE